MSENADNSLVDSGDVFEKTCSSAGFFIDCGRSGSLAVCIFYIFEFLMSIGCSEGHLARDFTSDKCGVSWKLEGRKWHGIQFEESWKRLWSVIRRYEKRVVVVVGKRIYLWSNCFLIYIAFWIERGVGREMRSEWVEFYYSFSPRVPVRRAPVGRCVFDLSS